jgi:hypothetical protein
VKNEHTPGPWLWRVSEKSRQATLMNERSVYVMNFERWGMNGAAPTFYVGGIMRSIKDGLLVDVHGREHHREWCADIDHPDARLIAAAPLLLHELQHLVRLLEPIERDGGLDVPGLATLNGARAAIAKARGGA